jgi:hypothetical protein
VAEADFFQMTPYHNPIWKWEVEVLETFENPVFKWEKIRRRRKKSAEKFREKSYFFEIRLYPTFIAKNAFFVQESAAELTPFYLL